MAECSRSVHECVFYQLMTLQSCPQGQHQLRSSGHPWGVWNMTDKALLSFLSCMALGQLYGLIYEMIELETGYSWAGKMLASMY